MMHDLAEIEGQLRRELSGWAALPDADTRRYFLVIRPTAAGVPGALRITPNVPDGWQAVCLIRPGLGVDGNHQASYGPALRRGHHEYYFRPWGVQMWIDVKNRLPEHHAVVFVRVGNAYAVAEYDKYFGFYADWEAYDIYCHDDSGLTVTLDGKVSHWMPIPD